LSAFVEVRERFKELSIARGCVWNAREADEVSVDRGKRRQEDEHGNDFCRRRSPGLLDDCRGDKLRITGWNAVRKYADLQSDVQYGHDRNRSDDR